MNKNNSFENELASAITANKQNKIFDWTIAYLQSHHRNRTVLEDIQKRKIDKVLFIEFPLGLLSRPEGPLNGEEVPESLHEWVRRVKEIREDITTKQMPPPVIASDFWEKLYIMDGNHRHEALIKSGIKSYWTIFLLTKPDSEEKIHEEIKKLDMQQVKGIIVDVGGVLVQEVNHNGRAVWETKLDLKQGQLTEEVYKTEKANLATVGKIKPVEIWLEVKNKYNLSSSEIEKLKQDFHAGDMLNNEFFIFMQSMHQRYTTAILSNAWIDAREAYTNKYYLDLIADEMIISAEVGMRKPHKNIFELVLHKIHLKPEELVYVDDNEDNIIGAKAVGMKTVIFTSTEKAIKDIENLCREP